MRTGEAPVAPAHAILGPVVAGMSRVRHRRVSRTGRRPQGARERSGGGNQVRGDAVSYDVHPRPPLGKVLTIALTALALLAGACGTGETAAERGDPAAGLVDDGGDSGDSAAGLVDDGGDSGDSAAGLVDESDGGDASSGGGGEGAGLQRPGDGSDVAPRMVVELGPERVSLSPGGGCWITDDGSAECWDGDDEWSQDGDFVQISAGTLFACGVTSDSSVRCWSKEHGEGFFQSWRDTTEEIPVPEGKPVMQVEVDGPHLCAVHADGTLGCYGRKYYGIVLTSDDWEAPGLGSLPSGSFTQISTGGWRESDSTGMSCGIRADSGTLACWGYFGEQPAPEGEYSQVSVSLGLVSGELSVGGIPIPYGVGVLICGVLTDHGAECWSMDGTDEDGKRIAVKYYAPDGQFAQVSAGSEYVCGLRTEGTVECWQLDRPESSREDGAETDADYPPAEVRLPGDRRLNGISVGGGARACGIRLDGALECWNILESDAPSSEVAAPSFTVDEDVDGLFRASGSGRFGFNVEFGEGAWVPVVSSNGQYRLNVLGHRPLSTPGEAACRPPFFGDALRGAGDVEYLIAMERERADATLGPAIVIGHGRGAMCDPGDFRVSIVTSDERTQWTIEFRREAAHGWGFGGAVALSRSDAEFVHIDAATEWSWQAFRGQSYVCGILAHGGTECWGAGYGERSNPPAAEFTQISSGSGYACGLTPERAMECWYWEDELSASLSSEASEILEIESAELAVCALLASGEIACDPLWSDEDSEHFRDIATFDHRIAGVSLSESGLTLCAVSFENEATCRGTLGEPRAPRHRFKQVATSDRHACGILMDDSVECWSFFDREEWSSYDEDMQEYMRDPPDGQFTQVSVGDYHSCGLRVDGTVACWGWNRFGQSTPPEGRFTQLVSTMHMSCGLRPDGSVECWGYAGKQ